MRTKEGVLLTKKKVYKWHGFNNTAEPAAFYEEKMVFKSMDEFAKEVATDFEKWCRAERKKVNNRIIGKNPTQAYKIYRDNSKYF